MEDDIILMTAEEKMEKTVEALKENYSTLRTGRAATSMLDRIEIDYYGSMTPINQLSSITIPEPRQLLIKPYDRNDLKAIVGAINASDLGLNPVNDGTQIRLVIPPLTEDRRKYAEDSKVAIRNVRREAMDEVKKDSSFTEDSRKIEEQEIQKLTDNYVKKIDEVYSLKEKDIMTI